MADAENSDAQKDEWIRAFADHFYLLAEGRVDVEWMSAFSFAIYPFESDRDPVRAADLVFLTLEFEFDGS